MSIKIGNSFRFSDYTYKSHIKTNEKLTVKENANISSNETELIKKESFDELDENYKAINSETNKNEIDYLSSYLDGKNIVISKIISDKINNNSENEIANKSIKGNKISEESTSVSRKVGVNAGKTARKISAARTKSQLRAVIAEIKNDVREISEAIEKGWCDETEMDKLNALMSMAESRMVNLEDREPTVEEESIYMMASLM
ncbi:MAG: hypothetical protein IKM20_09690 [Erysipelotrichales bacterium]|nr:hypothetical protein [Erysipelotrichales bacterium]